MLGKMLIHGLVAAAVIGSGAAVYAQVKDNGYLPSVATAEQRKETLAETGNGILRPKEANVRDREDERRGARSERRRERHDRKRDHDDDDD